MRPLFLAAFVLLAAQAGAATQAKVKRGDLEVKIKITGTVIPEDVFRIKSTIEGRVETVLTSTYVWRGADQPLAFLAHKELAAMIDSKGAQNVDILEDRWQRLYRPTPARCPDTCFILKSFLKPKTWVKPDSLMFEAAGTLKLVARVRSEDAAWIKDGQDFTFWAVKNPKRVFKGRVTKFILDVQGEKVAPGATFTINMSPDRFFEPDTEWEGQVIPMSKKDVLIVPTGALIRHGDSVYLPIRVSTGITTQGLTQIAAGTQDGKEVLVLDDAQLFGAERHKQEALRVEPEPVRRMPTLGDGPASIKKKSRHAPVIEDNTDYGEDPYAEPQ